MNSSHLIHPLSDSTKSRKPLTIRVPLPREIQFRLSAQTDKKLGTCRIGLKPCHGDGPVFVREAGLTGSFQGNRWQRLLFKSRVESGLNHFYFHSILRLIVRLESHRSMKSRVSEKSPIHILQKVFTCYGSFLVFQVNPDITQRGLNNDVLGQSGKGAE